MFSDAASRRSLERESDSGRARLADVHTTAGAGTQLALWRSCCRSGGRKVPVALQRMRAEDLLAAVFPEQVHVPGQSHRTGRASRSSAGQRDHRAIACTKLWTWMAWRKFSRHRERGASKPLAIDTPWRSSPMAHEILNANPIAFVDDRAPLEERRARGRCRCAVSICGWAVNSAGSISGDRRSANRHGPARNPDELHDLLLSVGLCPSNGGPIGRY